MYQEFKDVLSAFRVHGVKYLVVGGYAVIFHTQPRATKDLDLLILADPENAKATYAALAGFGMPMGDVRPEDFADPKNFFRFGHSLAASIFFQTFQGSISKPHGSAELKVLLMWRRGSRQISSPQMI